MPMGLGLLQSGLELELGYERWDGIGVRVVEGCGSYTNVRASGQHKDGVSTACSDVHLEGQRTTESRGWVQGKGVAEAFQAPRGGCIYPPTYRQPVPSECLGGI